MSTPDDVAPLTFKDKVTMITVGAILVGQAACMLLHAHYKKWKENKSKTL